MHSILVIGGYGFFGSRICRSLSAIPGIRLLIGGRDIARARALAQRLRLAAEQAVVIDAGTAGLAQTLQDLRLDTVIHTAGPFQNQNYAVAEAAIAAGCHYIDLADGRQFVAGISALNAAAKARGVAVISGASSVPGLSSAVVERHRSEFQTFESLAIGISSGARAPGPATVRGIFSYVGKPIRRYENGNWVTTYGWLDLKRHRFPPPLGLRLLGSCDVPDLDLFPLRYPSLSTVTFHAGFASGGGHRVVWTLAGLVKAGILSSASGFAAPLNHLSRWLEPLISDRGGMFVTMAGTAHGGLPLTRTWYLLAGQNHGPIIPCGAAIALAAKLAAGQALSPGAMPCVGLLTVDEYLAPLRDLDIREVTT